MVTRNYKPLLSLILIVCSWQSSFAGGPIGGDISYKFLYANFYEVRLVLYQADLMDSLNRPVKVFVNSSCYPSDTLDMNSYTPLNGNSGEWGGMGYASNCKDTVMIDTLPLDAFYYVDTIALPGTCSDFSFSYQQCCRDSVIDNILQPENTAFFIKANLNNTLGPNSSPEFYTLPGLKFYRDVTSHTASMIVAEPDNDSIFFKLSPARDSAGVGVIYNSGFSANQPYPSQTPFGQGVRPTQAGEYTVVVEVEEYRSGISFPLWIKVGSSAREVTYFVEDTFPTGVVSSAFGGPNVVDTIRNVHCGDSVVSFKIDRFLAGSLTQEGTEFRVLGTDTLIRPVIEAGCYDVRPDLTCDSVWLKLYKPLESNDTAYVVLKVGGDGNTLLNSCGNEFAEQDLGVLILKGCQNTSLDENLNSKPFSIYPNPTKDKITIEFEEDETPELCTLFDMQGRELKSVVPQSFKTELDISSFSKGVYLLEIKSAGLSQTRLVQKL